MAKYGKKNVIKIDPLAYNIGLLGEGGIGKTTLFVRVLEHLAGSNGYMILNCGMEDGIDAIPDAMYEDIPDYDTFEDFVNEIIENKDTDYQDLKAVVIDSIDELFRITETEVVRLHNREQPDKPKNSIKGAFGGYGAGEDKAISLVLENIALLKKAGISVWFIGHTKRKTMNDLFSGAEYDMITNNMSAKYFNAIKDKLHIMGIAYIDRNINKEKVGVKTDITGKEKAIMKGVVKEETRKITFRDDNHTIDSKSRFDDIVETIDFGVNEFIGAIEDAIRKQHEKQTNKKDIKEAAKEQEKAKEEESKKNIEKMKLDKYQNEIIEFIKENKKDTELMKKVLLHAKEIGIENIKEIQGLDQAESIVSNFIYK